jgi:hypothetical protein
MASATQTTEYKRKLRRKRAGAAAKRARQNKGTTVPFKVHSDAAVANAPVAQLSPEQVAARQG